MIPTPSLAPTAERLLEAARAVLRRYGFERLTFEAIASESGETQSLIRYHFGDKAGLIRTLVESDSFLESDDVKTAVADARPGPERRRALLRRCRDIATAQDELRNYLELLPRLARDENLRPLLKTLVDWYVRLNVGADPTPSASTGRPGASRHLDLRNGRRDGPALPGGSQCRHRAGIRSVGGHGGGVHGHMAIHAGT